MYKKISAKCKIIQFFRGTHRCFSAHSTLKFRDTFPPGQGVFF